MSTKISKSEMVAYGLGDMGSNFIFQISLVYLTIFYTDVFGISAAMVSVIFLVARVWDAINDPIMGSVIDKANLKGGKFKPYMIYGAIPLAIVNFLTFTTPDLSEVGKIIWAFSTYLSLGMIYTAVNCPYGAMSSSMTSDQKERTDLSAIRTIFALFGGIAMILTPILVNFIGKDDPAFGWQMTVALLSVIGATLIIYSGTKCQERIKSEPNKDTITPKTFLNAITVNKPLSIICFCVIVIYGNNAIASGAGAYFFKYVVGDFSLMSGYIGITLIATILGAVCAKLVSGKFEKKTIFLFGLSIAISRPLSMYASDLPIIYTFTAIGAAGMGMAMGVIWSLVADTVEYGELKTGKRSEGIIYSTIGFFFKLGSALGGIIPGLILTITGYVANVEQTPEAVEGIRLMAGGIPAVMTIVLIIIATRYPLSKAKFKAVISEIDSRKQGNEPKEVLL